MLRLAGDIKEAGDDFRLLRARDGVTVIKNITGHAADTEPVHTGIFRLDREQTGVAAQVIGHSICIQTLAGGNRDKIVDVANIDAIDEIGVEQCFDKRAGFAIGAGETDQAMGVQAIGHAANLIEIEQNSFRLTGLLRRGMDTLNAIIAAEFPFQIGLPLNTVGRQFGIEQKGTPSDFRNNVRSQQ